MDLDAATKSPSLEASGGITCQIVQPAARVSNAAAVARCHRRRRVLRLGRRVSLDAIDPYRLDNVLDLLFAQKLVAEWQLGLDLIIDAAGDENAAGIGKRLQSGRNVDPIAEQVGALDDDIAEVDADAKLEVAIAREVEVSLRQLVLGLGRATCRLDRACELREDTVRRDYGLTGSISSICTIRSPRREAIRR